MEGKTHYVGGAVATLAGYLVLSESGSLLSTDIVSPAFQFLIIYTGGMYGGRFPDIDHHSKSNPMRDPVGVFLNKVLHIFNGPLKKIDDVIEMTSSGKEKMRIRRSFKYRLLKFLACKHRAWQTHSEFTLFMLYLLFQVPSSLGLGVNGLVDKVILELFVLGLTLGIVSHIVLDAMTYEGSVFAIGTFIKTMFPSVPMITNIRLVPKIKTFTTGSPYEMFVRRILTKVQFVLLALVIAQAFGISTETIVDYIISYIK